MWEPLAALYLVLLAFQTALTARAARGRCPWRWPLLLELLCALGAAGAAAYFDRLPGYGFMPGLTWLGHVLFSLGAAGAYAGMLVLTGVLAWWKRRR